MFFFGGGGGQAVVVMGGDRVQSPLFIPKVDILEMRTFLPFHH